jgi:hypothetical protein
MWRPDRRAREPAEFWEKVNKPWLDDAIARGDKFRFVSDPALETSTYVTSKTGEFILDHGKRVKSIFWREMEYLKSKGYVFQPERHCHEVHPPLRGGLRGQHGAELLRRGVLGDFSWVKKYKAYRARVK